MRRDDLDDVMGAEDDEVSCSSASSSRGDKDQEFARVKSTCQECAPIRIARDPGDPTAREREDHCVTHIPYRSWCPICVKAKGKEEAH